MNRLIFFASLIALWISGACGGVTGKYVPNSQSLVDQMYAASDTFVKDIPLSASSRVAIVNLDGKRMEASSPSQPIYDLLAVALTKRKIPVVERDAEGLYASILESWSSRLPFRVTSPCGALCDKAPEPPPAPKQSKSGDATIIVQGCSTSCATDAKIGDCKTCAEPTLAAPAADLVQLVTELGRLKAKQGGAAAPAAAPRRARGGKGPKAVSSVPVSSRSYRDIFSKVILPGWYNKDGERIVAEQASATHVLGYRVLTYGVAEFATDNEMEITREVRIDVVLRLIRVKDGVIEWSDRYHHNWEERVSTDEDGDWDHLYEDPHTYWPAQYAPISPET